MSLRAPRLDEAAAVARLLAARDRAAFGWSELALADLLDEWRHSEFDLARDAIVAEAAGGTLAGYAVAHRFGTFATVDAAWEGRGIGTALLDWCERRQRELGWEAHRTAIPAGNARAESLLSSRGYELVRSISRMRLALADFRPGPSPGEVTMRALEIDADGPALYALDREAFAAVAGTEPEECAAFIEEHLEAHDVDSALSFVAERRGEAAGFALTRRRTSESAVYIAILAVHPREQGRGIGRALLGEVFEAARRAGLDEAQLGVASDNPKALRLYEGLGMTPRAQLDVYERALK